MTKKFYAIKRGHVTGIFYDEWKNVFQYVDRCKSPMYKGFQTWEAADHWMKSSALPYDPNISSKVGSRKNDQKSPLEGLLAYTDGSYNKRTNRYSYAAVITKNNVVIKEIGGDGAPRYGLDMRQVTGEIKGAMKAVQYAVNHGYDRVTICYDYRGVQYWATHQWKANNVYTKGYQDFMDKASHLIEIKFHKVKAHVGNRYNEMADQLAKKQLFSTAEIPFELYDDQEFDTKVR